MGVWVRGAVVLFTLSTLFAGEWVSAQPAPRRIATVTALRTYPGFYHAQPVLVRGELQDVDSARPPALADEQMTVRLLTRESVPTAGTYEVRGEALDVGRLSADDPRLSGVDLRGIGVDRDERWPRQGEIVVLRVTSLERAQPLAAPSIRTLALEPQRYVDQRVTVAGQFRGRNLYGDLPQAPAAAQQSRGAFVLRSADAAIWALGRQPRGRGFQLNPTSRLDTQRWLEVSGTVREERGLVWIEVQELREIEARQEEAPREEPPPPPAPIPPEVLFSAPTDEEIDVPLDTNVRIQFSRDLDPETLKGRIRAAYLGAPEGAVLETSYRYDPGRRALEIGFAQPLEPFRTMRVQLLEGVAGTDGAPLEPWSLTFSLGAR